MKRCPECRRDYYDDTLAFCLEDGTALIQGPVQAPDGETGEPATAIINRTGAETGSPTREPLRTADQTAILPTSTGAVVRSARIPTKLMILAPIVLAVLLIGGFFGYRYFQPTRQIGSIAVMPFLNEGGNEDVDYLSDGMTESLISSLSQLPNLTVKARSSVFRYKGKEVSPKTIGSELGVEALVNGRLVQRGNDLIAHVEVVDTHTENVLWKFDYSRTMSNLVSLQNEITRDVAARLRERLSAPEQKQIAKNHTENPEAYRLYLQGRFHWNKRRPEEHLRAIKYFEQAIALDPNYALAYSGIADCYAVSSSPIRGEERVNKLRAAANKALELDPTLGEPHAALGALADESWDWSYGEQEYKKAIELNPTYPTAHQWYAELLSRLGRHDEAIAEIKRAQELDPLSLVINSDMIYILTMARQYDEAIEQAKKTLEMDPRWRSARGFLTQAYLSKGLFEEAISEREKQIEGSEWPPDRRAAAMEELTGMREGYRTGGPEGFWRKLLEFQMRNMGKVEESSPTFYAQIHAALGNKDEAFKWLSKAIDEKESGIDLLKVDPAFDSLRADPRFDELLRRMNLL